MTEMVALRDELNRRHAAERGELSPLALAIRAIVRAVAESAMREVVGRREIQAILADPKCAGRSIGVVSLARTGMPW